MTGRLLQKADLLRRISTFLSNLPGLPRALGGGGSLALPPWTAERTITATGAARLIGDQFPELAPARVLPLGEGWDNTVFQVNERWAFRFPRRAIAVPLLATESRILPALAPILPLPIPEPRFHGAPSGDYPWPFLGYALLPGSIAASVHLPHTARVAMTAPLAHFLRALHDVPITVAEGHDVPLDTIERLSAVSRAPMTDARLEALLRGGVIASRAPFDAILSAAVPFTPTANHVVHGDLHASQLLVDGEQRVSAVIDWGDVHLGDPATDLAGIHQLLPPEAHGAFLAIYGDVDPMRWQAARVRATWHSIALAAYALDIGDAARLADARTSLGFLLAYA